MTVSKKKSNGNAKCPAGKIERNAAKVEGYTRADGVKVRAANRKASCVVNRGAPGSLKAKNGSAGSSLPNVPGEGPKDAIKIPNRDKDLLQKYGYDTSLPEEKRHEALRKAAREVGHIRVIRYLNGLANLQVRTSPRISALLRADQQYISGLYEKAKERENKK